MHSKKGRDADTGADMRGEDFFHRWGLWNFLINWQEKICNSKNPGKFRHQNR
jgi:hypothetical protein